MKNIYCLIFFCALLVSIGQSIAQEATKPIQKGESVHQAPLQAEMMELAKASQNPVADMNSVPIQFNWYTGGGLGDQTSSTTLIQPVLPLGLSKDWNIVSRTVIPLVNAPMRNGERAKGLGDIQEQIYFSNSKKHKIITGYGPIFSFPTSNNQAWSTGQFALGPTAVALMMTKKWVFGAIANQLWRIAGSDMTTPINQFFLQPFVNYNFKLGWSLGTAPAITANRSAPSGQQWTFPLGISVSKITVVGHQPLSLTMQYYNNVVRPDAAGANQIRMQVSFLFPRKAI
jgi:hypothetical protein